MQERRNGENMEGRASFSGESDFRQTGGVDLDRSEDTMVRPLRSSRLRCLTCNHVAEWANTLSMPECHGAPMALIFTVGMKYDNLDGIV